MPVKPFKTGLTQTGMIKSGGRSLFLLLRPTPPESALASCMHVFSQEVILLRFKCLQLKHLDIIKYGIRRYICILHLGAAHLTVCVISQSVLSLEPCLHLAVTSQHSPAFHTFFLWPCKPISCVEFYSRTTPPQSAARRGWKQRGKASWTRINTKQRWSTCSLLLFGCCPAVHKPPRGNMRVAQTLIWCIRRVIPTSCLSQLLFSHTQPHICRSERQVC